MNKEPSNQAYFGIIPDTVFFDERLSDKQKLIYVLVQKLTFKEGYCFASNKYMAEQMNCNKYTISRAISKLEELEYFHTKQIKNEKGEIIQRRIYPNYSPFVGKKLENNQEGGYRHKTQGGIDSKSNRGIDARSKDKYISNYNNISLINRYSPASPDGEKKDPSRDLRKDIIDYLNKKADKNFKPNSNKTKSCINARFKEGFNDLDDYKKVIDIKTHEWKNSPSMNKFLRPETLFGTKFEGYLNQKSQANNQIQSRTNDYYEELKRSEERMLNGESFNWLS